MAIDHALPDVLKGYRYNIGSELEFRREVVEVLNKSNIECVPEYDLGRQFGRIDVYLPQSRIGIEVKVKDSRSQILRQLHRYSLCPLVDSLVLLTSRPRFDPPVDSISGKSLTVISVWEGLL